MKQYLGAIAALTLAIACARGDNQGATSFETDSSGNIAETGANQQTGASAGSSGFFGASGLPAMSGAVSGTTGNTTEASTLTTSGSESGGVVDGYAGVAVIDGSANEEFGDANPVTSGMDGSSGTLEPTNDQDGNATGCALNAVAQTLAGCDECVTCEQAMCCGGIMACINDATCSATVGCQDDCYNDDTLSPDEADMCADNCPGTSTELFVGYDSCNGGLCETACACP